MRKASWTGICTGIVALTTAIVVAQASAPPQSTTQSSDQKITVTGCLKQAPASPADTAATGATGTTGTTGAAGATDSAAAAQKFVLTNATPTANQPSGDAPTAAAGSSTPGAPASAAPPASSPQTYRLIANPASLMPHLGKKLELTGTLEAQNSTAPANSSSAGSESNAPALRVLSGKIVADSCSE